MDDGSMDLIFLAKITASLLSALAAWWGFRKFRAVLALHREAIGPRPAKPFTSLVYSWSGPAAHPKQQELRLQLGNRDNRQVIVKEFTWYSPAFRLKWPALPSNAATIRLQSGEGTEVNFEPLDSLDNVAAGHHFTRLLQRLIIICGLRLVVNLQTGERLVLRAPSALRSFLARKYGFGIAGRGVVWLHHRVWP